MGRCLAALALALGVSSAARAEVDPWFGRDKALHFGASATLASGGYGAGRLLLDERRDALVLGAAVGLSAGVAKELADLAGYGHPSWRDLGWDLAGVASGLLFSWGLERVLEQLFFRTEARE